MPLIFAYGSNLDQAQMRERCPSAQMRGIASLPGHRLAFPRTSTKRKCGVASAVPDPHREVWGVLYEISEQDLAELDEREGYRVGRSKNSYLRREVDVLLDGKPGSLRRAETYFAVPQEGRHLPSSAYMGLIFRGARHWNLPDAYVSELERMETADPKPDRSNALDRC